MKRKALLLVFLACLCSVQLFGQARKGLKINEIMIVNDSSAVDEYGRHSAWIELFNSDFKAMEISSVYLTNDLSQPKLYPVPLGDVKTKLPKRQHIVFWADNRPTDGTFHVNFKFDPTRPNVVAIFDADGKTLIDSVTVPVMQPGQSYARTDDGVGEWTVRHGIEADDYITPGSPNKIKGTNPKIEEFKEKDENGFAMTITAMGIVFSALILLSVCFWIISKINSARSKRKKMEAQGIVAADLAPDQHPEGDSGEEIAAIAMALHDHLDAHDKESAVLTINKVRKAYSPWSSHIYTLRQMPNRR